MKHRNEEDEIASNNKIDLVKLLTLKRAKQGNIKTLLTEISQFMINHESINAIAHKKLNEND